MYSQYEVVYMRVTKSTTKSLLILFILSIFFGCKSKSSTYLSEMVPIALKGSDPLLNDFSSTSNETESQTPNDYSDSGNMQLDIPTSNEPIAWLEADLNGVDRFKNLLFKFSKPMDNESITYGTVFTIEDSTSTPVSGVITWNSPYQMEFNPEEELADSETYTVHITSDAKTTFGIPLTEYTANFQAEPSFTMTHTINGITVGGSQGVILDKTVHPTLNLSSTLSNPDKVKSLKLCVMGKTSGTGLVTCREGVAMGIEICNQPSCSTTINLNLSASLLPPIEGANSYYYHIQSTADKNYYRPVNFNYGKLATVAEKTGLLPKVALAVLDDAQAIPELENLIKNYAKGEFTLSGRSLQEFATGKPSDPIPGDYVSNTRPTTDANGNPCLDWTKKDGSTFSLKYLKKIGPFCNIVVSGTIFESATYPNVKYVAGADVYITDLQIDPTVPASPDDNISILLNPQSDGSVNIDLYGKRASGKMALVAKLPDAVTKTSTLTTGNNTITVPDTSGLIVGMVATGTGIPGGTTITSIAGNSIILDNAVASSGSYEITFSGIEFFTYLVGDTFVYYGSLGYDKEGNTITPPPSGDAISFSLNDNPPSLLPRLSQARALVDADINGDLGIRVNPTPVFNIANCSAFNPTLCNPFTKNWSDNIATSAVIGSGAVPSIIADVVNQKIEEVKPQVVQGVVRDIAENVAPQIINNIIGQLKNGINIQLPSYLPSPFDKTKLTAKIRLDTDLEVKNNGSVAGLESSAYASLGVTIDPPQANFPPTPLGTDSFVLLRNNSSIPLNHPNSVLFTRSGTGANQKQGVLLALHSDAISQAVYHLWKAGGLNFEINKAFIDQVNDLAGKSSLLALTEALLKAGPIVTVLAPGQEKFSAKDQGGNPIEIYPQDDVVLVLNPILTPMIRVASLSGIPGQYERPDLDITLYDLEIEIQGIMNDPSRPSPNTTRYTMSKVRVSLKSKANLDFGTYTNPDPEGNPSMSDLNGHVSAKIHISDAVGDLYYIVEPGEGADRNPLGLDPIGIWEVFDPLVKTLVLPLLNNVLTDIPLPEMKKCGIELKNLNVMDVPANLTEPYILLSTELDTYTFTNDCVF